MIDFRKIDVDQYDDEALLESDLVEPDARPPAQILADAKAKSTEVRGLIQR
jgi:actin related protein 2/3 complex subunit 5